MLNTPLVPQPVVPADSHETPAMIWFLERGVELMACEARRNGARFELAISSHDGPERVERIDDPTELIQRINECHREARRHGWRILAHDNGMSVTVVPD